MRPETLRLLDHVVGELTRAVTFVRTDTAETIGANDHVALIRHFAATRNVVEQIKEARKALDEIEDRLSKEDVPSAMRAAGVKTITVEGVGRVTVSNRFSCSILDKPVGFEWLRDNGHGGLISETVNSSTLSAFAKNLLEVDGKELPDDVFKTSIQSYTSITKA